MEDSECGFYLCAYTSWSLTEMLFFFLFVIGKVGRLCLSLIIIPLTLSVIQKCILLCPP